MHSHVTTSGKCFVQENAHSHHGQQCSVTNSFRLYPLKYVLTGWGKWTSSNILDCAPALEPSASIIGGRTDYLFWQVAMVAFIEHFGHGSPFINCKKHTGGYKCLVHYRKIYWYIRQQAKSILTKEEYFKHCIVSNNDPLWYRVTCLVHYNVSKLTRFRGSTPFFRDIADKCFLL